MTSFHRNSFSRRARLHLTRTSLMYLRLNWEIRVQQPAAGKSLSGAWRWVYSSASAIEKRAGGGTSHLEEGVAEWQDGLPGGDEVGENREISSEEITADLGTENLLWLSEEGSWRAGAHQRSFCQKISTFFCKKVPPISTAWQQRRWKYWKIALKNTSVKLTSLTLYSNDHNMCILLFKNPSSMHPLCPASSSFLSKVEHIIN